jgi:acyl-CoA thioesterase I
VGHTTPGGKPDWHLSPPFWAADTIWEDSVLFLRQTQAQDAEGRLLLRPASIASVRSSSGEVEYEEGRDYTVEAPSRRLLLPPGSRIPFLEQADLYRVAGQANGIDHLAGDPTVQLLFGEGRYYHDLQIAVTYAPAEAWPGAVPAGSEAALLRTRRKLAAGAPLRLCLSGDSISAGANASGCTGAPPHMPAYGELVAWWLQTRCGSQVSFRNLAVGGMGAAHGVEVAAAAADWRPDLMLVAYGMNDVGRRDPETFRQQIAAGMEIVRRGNPEVDFVLVAPMLGNPEWVHTPPEMFPLYRDALASLCTPQVALADITRLWTDLLCRKRFHDLTGNGVNHPNDWGHRAYAQVVLALLSSPQA